jgi:hypothetical protein
MGRHTPGTILIMGAQRTPPMSAPRSNSTSGSAFMTGHATAAITADMAAGVARAGPDTADTMVAVAGNADADAAIDAFHFK